MIKDEQSWIFGRQQLPSTNSITINYQKLTDFFKGIKYIIKKAILGQQTLELHFSNGRLNDAF